MFPASGADGERVVLHTLFDFKTIAAGFALVLVDGHDSFPPTSPVYLVIWSIWFVWFFGLDATNRINKTNR
jgi:hypothetical protein